MNFINKSQKVLSLLFVSCLFTSSALAGGGCGGGGSKPEKIAKYKTPQLVSFVNSTVDLLNSQENPNKRHLNTLLKCQKTFNSGKLTAKGMEARGLKTCKNLMSKGGYDLRTIATKVTEDQITNKETPIAANNLREKKVNKIIETDNLTKTNDTDLLLF